MFQIRQGNSFKKVFGTDIVPRSRSLPVLNQHFYDFSNILTLSIIHEIEDGIPISIRFLIKQKARKKIINSQT